MLQEVRPKGPFWPKSQSAELPGPRYHHTHMQSSLHGMIDKAHRYAEEPERVQLARLEALVRGDNSDHTVYLAEGRLSCDCDHYQHERLCAHVLTVERVLKSYIPANAAPFPGS
jgi:hypothetical protein